MIVSRDYMMSTWCLWRFLIQSYCTLRHWFSRTAPPPIAECTYKMEICFPGVKGGRVVTLTPHPLLVQWSRRGRAIPPLPLWAARPVQSLSACTRVYFTFTFTFTQSITYPYVTKMPDTVIRQRRT